MILKTLSMAIIVIFSAFGALALDHSGSATQLQIVTDLQLADEIESLNQGQAAQVWLLGGDEEPSGLEGKKPTRTQRRPKTQPQSEIKGISHL